MSKKIVNNTAGDDEYVPGPGPIGNLLDQPSDDMVFQVEGGPERPPTDAHDLVHQVASGLEKVLFETGLTPLFIWVYGIVNQLFLMHLGTPPDLEMLAHSPNADLLLIPGIDVLLAMAPAIKDRNPRALRDVNLNKVAQTRDLLKQYRGLLKKTNVVSHCIEAGITHMEQYLHGTATRVYPRLQEQIATDYDFAQELQELTKLVKDPSEQSQQSKKVNKKVEENTINKIVEGGQGQAQGTGTTAHGSTGPGATGQGPGTPTTPQTTGGPGTGTGTTGTVVPPGIAVPPAVPAGRGRGRGKPGGGKGRSPRRKKRG